MKYEQWIKFSFDRPISEPSWYWDIDDESDMLEDSLAIEFLSMLFSTPMNSLAGMSDEQVHQGLWYLISSSSSPCIDALFSEKVPWENRLACIRSIKILFEEFFCARCLEVLSRSDLDGSISRRSPINSICYMFWDLIPWMNGGTDDRVSLVFIDVVEEILSLQHIACQESALHALGHSQTEYPLRVMNMIDGFLADNPNLGLDLKEYALNARRGAVQ